VRPESPTRRDRLARVGVRVVAVLLSTIVGLGLAELLVGAVRGWAFPYLNIFVADPDYGVRLEPNAVTAVRSREGRVTDIRTNARGFRGDDWSPALTGAPVPGRVLLLGDSQVFAYGVEEEDGVAARLEAALGAGAEVLDAATPTWGPPEYARVAAELAPVYRPEVVVFVANVANDWLEAHIPNVRRTTARDGWASYRRPDVPVEPDSAVHRWLFGRSHLVYAVRALLSGVSGDPPAGAVSARRLLSNLTNMTKRDGAYRTRLTRHVAAVRDACASLGCRVVVAVLPLDLQVDAGEWAKYRDTPEDLGALDVLARDLLADAADLGVPGVDLRPVLVRASPGAFLPDDYHLAPRGHAAVAAALATLVAAPAAGAPAP
ncbi:MAG: hypothetical protein KC635_13550, partial [Myxococcales bacterium]|nr:hypothetical protein [Myxococcales bacterium]